MSSGDEGHGLHERFRHRCRLFPFYVQTTDLSCQDLHVDSVRCDAACYIDDRAIGCISGLFYRIGKRGHRQCHDSGAQGHKLEYIRDRTAAVASACQDRLSVSTYASSICQRERQFACAVPSVITQHLYVAVETFGSAVGCRNIRKVGSSCNERLPFEDGAERSGYAF